MRPTIFKLFKPKLALVASLGFLCFFFLAKNLSAKATLTHRMIAYEWVYSKITQTNKSVDAEYLANIILSDSRRLLNNDYKTSTCIIKVESNFRNSVIGDDGVSVGMSQIRISAAKDSCRFLGLPNCSNAHIAYLIHIPKYNVLLGIGYLSFLINRYKNKNKAIGAYNIGISYIDGGGRNKKYLEKINECKK